MHINDQKNPMKVNQLQGKIRRLLFESIYVLMLFVASCDMTATYNNRVEDKNSAQEVTDKFYHLLQKGMYSENYALFNRNFLETTDTSKITKLYHATFQRLGAIENISLQHWETHVVTYPPRQLHLG